MTEIKMPQLGLTMTEGIVTRWHKAEGDSVRKGEPLFDVETDKLTNTIESEADGILRKIYVTEGSEVPVQTVLCVIGDLSEAIAAPAPAPLSAPSPEAAAPEQTSVKPDAAEQTGEKRIRVSPLAKRIARERGIDLSAVKGTGPGGRILSRDLPESQSLQAPAAPDVPATPAATEQTETQDGVRRVPMSAMRKAIAKNMLHSWVTAPVVHYTRSADATALAELKALLARDGRKISYTDILIKLVAGTLMEFPLLNASIDGTTILFHDYVHMGIAVALDDGLVVPVIRNAHEKGIAAISAEVRALAERARAGALSAAEMRGGTFTITNLGMFGIEHFTPIINQPESAILGVGAIRDVAERDNGEIVMKPKMPLSLTADHRIIDGAVAARFLQDVCDRIENPWRMLL